MRTGRPKRPLLLTEEERAGLESMAHRARSQPLLARRPRVVLACGDGLDNYALARKLRCSLGMVGKWRALFLEDVERVVIQTLESTSRGQTHWSTPGTGEDYRTEPYDHQPDLEGLRFATASQ